MGHRSPCPRRATCSSSAFDGVPYAVESLALLVARTGVAVAQRRLGPSSSATTSTVERALPSSAVQVRCWSRPMTTTRLPFGQGLGGVLGLVAPDDHGEE
jgi:hypothetical protein